MREQRTSRSGSVKNKLTESVILTNLMTNIGIVEFYFAKIEAYMRRKHDAVLKVRDPDNVDSAVSATDSEAETASQSEL